MKIVVVCLFAMLLLTACGRPGAPPTWQAVYTSILQQYHEETYHLPAEARWLFALHDINGNGAPELIIWESALDGFFFSAHTVYTFVDGEAMPLEMADDFGGHPASLALFSPPGGAGLVVTGGGEGFMRYMLVTMAENRLVIEAAAQISALPWHRGYAEVLHFIYGAEATPATLPNHLHWLTDEVEDIAAMGYILVEDTAFTQIVCTVFGDMEEHNGHLIHAITEANIASVIDGWGNGK